MDRYLYLVDMLRDGFGDKPWFGCLIAEEIHFSEGNNCLPKKKPVGYALFFDIYSTWEGRSLYLEDLYVNPAFRGKVVYWYLAVMYFNFVQIQLYCHVLSWVNRCGSYSLPATLKIWLQLCSAVINFWFTCSLVQHTRNKLVTLWVNFMKKNTWWVISLIASRKIKHTQL